MVSKFLCEGQLQGVSYLINGFGVSIEHAIKSPGNCFGQVWGFSVSILLFHASATSSGKNSQAVSSISGVRCAEVVGVTSRSRERHRKSAGFWADVSHKVSESVSASQRWACKAQILLFS